MLVLLVVGLAIGGGIGYFATPVKIETKETIKEVTVEVNPLKGKTIEIGATASNTAGLEPLVPLINEILVPDLKKYVDSLGVGVNFKFLIDDCGGAASVALEKTQAFNARGVNLIVGHAGSSYSMATLAYCNQNEMVQISGSSSSPLLSIPNDAFFRLCPTDFVQAPALVEMWRSWGVKGVITIHSGDTWGDGLWNLVVNEFPKKGIENLGEVRYAPEVKEFSSYLYTMNDIVTAAIEKYGGRQYVGLMFFSSSEWRIIESQAKDYPNLINLVWFATEGRGRDVTGLKEIPDLCIITHNFSPMMGVDEGSYEFMSVDNRYFQRLGYRINFYGACQYDAAWLYVKTILQTGSSKTADIKKSLIPVSAKQHGITGWLALDDKGDRIPQLFDIWGFYKDSTGTATFQKWGSYDGRVIQIKWDDAALLRDAGITRPAIAK